MSKYEVYRNSKHGHPAIEVEENLETKYWKSIEMTHSPQFKKDREGRITDIPKDKYEKFIVKPTNSEKDSYFVRYIRNDPIYTKKEKWKDIKLNESNIKQINDFLNKKRWYKLRNIIDGGPTN